jgi:REP element-mobilizing transposase RayT
MARQPRIELPGAVFHVISRGIKRRKLFRDDDDRRRYMAFLQRAIARSGARLYAYCLMSDQVHLAIEPGKISLSRVMRSLNTSYAGYFNARHRRVGCVFYGRYKALLVDREEYLLSLVRYIHENPVKAGVVRDPSRFEWSSHRHYLARPPAWLASGEVLRRFGRSRSVARRNFRAFFRSTEVEPYEKAKRHVASIVGNEGFAEAILKRSKPKQLLARSITSKWVVEWVGRRLGVSVADLAGPGRGRELSHMRAICGLLGRDFARISLARMAREFRRDGSTLWRNVCSLENAIESDRALKRSIDNLRARFVTAGNKT